MLAEESDSYMHIVKRINVSRAFIYFVVTGLQSYWLLECLSSRTPVFCNVNLVIVPAVLTLLDLALIVWTPEQAPRFLKAARIVSVIAILISINTLLPIIGRGRFDILPSLIMMIFGYIIIMISVIEISILILKDRVKYRTLNRDEEIESDSEIRTYDR